ncbi:FAD-dependent oxidoreductase [Dokdonia sp.]|uniref:FAD-dependent oxidoreductase n=1 Tax=Dokdonia sp. TaxID=2024995 RepID=UPI003267946C
MSEYKQPTSEIEFEQNFAQKKPLMNATEAYFESSKCLFCYDAPCIKACPTGIDIPLFIKQINSDNLTGSAKTIYESNWLGNSCGKICPTGELCEGACVFNHQDLPPIQIGRLQSFASTDAIKNEKKLFTLNSQNGRKVAIIGSGGAGIACACELRTMGYEVDIYEAKSKPSGLTLHGIAAYKITNQEVEDEINFLEKQIGLNFICDHPIENKTQLEKLEAEYDAIFLGVGIGATAQIGLPGENKINVIGAVEFIEELRMKHHQLTVPKRVIVIGGGNTAMDAASQSARMGAESVVLAYRRSKEDMGAYGFEYKLAINAGVESLFNAQPLEIVGNDKATGVQFIRTQEVNGRLENIQGSKFIVDADLVIKATGQAKQKHFLELIDGLELDNRKRIVVDASSFQCTNPKYFAGGDAVNGGAEVVNAAFEGKMAAQGIEKWLNK